MPVSTMPVNDRGFDTPDFSPASLGAFFNTDAAFEQEYTRVRTAGDTRSREDWLAGHIAASPQDQEKFSLFASGQSAPSTVGAAFNDTLAAYNAPSAPPPGFYDVAPPPPLPSAVQAVLDQLFGGAPGPAPGPAPTPSELANIQTAPSGGGVTIAPSNTTNNVWNQVVNYFFPAATGETDGVPGGAGANPAKLGQVQTPDTKLPGQTIDPTQNKPSGKSTITATLSGLDLPVVGKTGNLWLNVAILLFVPVVILAGLWLVTKAFRRG